MPTHEGRIFDTVLPAPFPFAFSTPGALLHKLQVSLLFQVLIFVSHFSAPVVRLMRLLRFLRLPALLRLLRPLISFVSFSYSLTSSAALLDGGLWGGYHGLLSPFRMVCRDFILPEGCKPCLFLSAFHFAKLIVPYPIGGSPPLVEQTGGYSNS